MKSIVTNHNKTILNKIETLNKKKCNCINKNVCPLSGEYPVETIIYQASLNSNQLNYDEKYYKSSSEIAFKKRFANHKKSFNTEQYKSETKIQRKYGILSYQITT